MLRLPNCFGVAACFFITAAMISELGFAGILTLAAAAISLYGGRIRKFRAPATQDIGARVLVD